MGYTQDTTTITIWIFVVILVFILLVSVIILYNRISIKRILQERDAANQAKIDFQKQLLHDSIEIQEAERNRIAADLHDDLISKLHVAKLGLQTNKEKGFVLSMLDKSMLLARRISHDLHPPMIEELSVSELLEELIQPLSEVKEVAYQCFEVVSNKHSFSIETKLQFVRVLQEVFSNIIKHAEASQIVVQLHHSNKLLAVVVQDNGKGFDQKKAGNGLGMKNIALRAQILKANYRFSSPAKGTRFIFAFRINEGLDD